jgi:phosphoribosylanthranilate isomerase
MFVKICGITNEDDALLATALDADALGFVFAPSPRQVHPEVARDIVRRLPREIHTIGVFRNERPERIVEIVNRAGLHGVQMHGHEPPAEVEWVRKRVQFVIRAYSAGDSALAEASQSAADIILVDSPDPGSGKVFDWRLAEGAPRGKRILLAGGLTPENVGEAIKLVRPWGVDVSTGVEQKPGRKDPAKLRRFVEAAREAGAEVSDGAAAHAIDLTVEDIAGVTRPWDWQIDR